VIIVFHQPRPSMTILARDQFGAAIPVIYPGPSQNVAFTAASTQSAPVGANTTIVRVVALGGDCRIVIGADPAADADSTPVMERVPEFFAIRPHEKIAVIRADAADGILAITEGANH
jgi:hypothetical protein